VPAGVPGIAIYQGGFAKCANVAGSCPYNGGASYYWYYYARPQGNCGQASNTGVVKAAKGNAGPGQSNYKVAFIPIDGQDYWAFWIDGSRQNTRPNNDVAYCWSGGAKGTQVMNEMLDDNDQNGGSNSNYENFDSVQYKNGTGWHGMNWTLARDCDANSYPTHWGCIVSHTLNDTFKNWDDRAP
jgi:hypothetical protein